MSAPIAAAQALEPLAYALHNLQVHLGGAAVLRGIDLQVRKGRWTSIVGPNGAGKSTLLRAMAHLQPSQGRIELLGCALSCYRPRERAQLVAWLGSHEAVAEEFSAYDVVMLGRMPHQGWLASASEHDHRCVAQAMQATQTWPFRSRAVGTLSGGQRQRVQLARVLAAQAPILLLDEPLANLDPPHQSQWLLDMRQLVAQGSTVVSVLHELSIALFSDDIVVMQDGRIVAQGTSDDPTIHQALVQVFEGRIRIVRVQGQWACLPHIAEFP